MDIVIRWLNPSLMLMMGFALGVILRQMYKTSWDFYGMGAAAFLGSQVFHIPFNLWVLNPAISGLQGLNWSIIPLWVAVQSGLVGLSAGIFEEITRYIVFRKWLPRSTRNEAWMFGAGHGGMEAMLTGLLVMAGLIKALALRGVSIESVVTPDKVELLRTQLELYWSLPWHIVLYGALERISALCFHLAATTLVWRAVMTRKPGALFAAIAGHTVFNGAALFAFQIWGLNWSEGIIALLGSLCLFYIIFSRLKSGTPATMVSTMVDRRIDQEIECEYSLNVTPEKMEDSKYS